MMQVNKTNPKLGPDYLWSMMQVNKKNPKLSNHTHMKDIMETWITRNNHPIVHIRRNGSMLFIRQSEKEFYIDDKGNAQVLRHWLPITFTTWEQLDFNDTTPHHWITPENSTGISVRLTSKKGWIILNLQQTGYYRVKYDKKSLKLIAKYLKVKEYEKIHVLNRAQIIDDTYYFVKSGVIPYTTFQNLISYLHRERDYVAWYPMFQIFRDISSFLPVEKSVTLKVSHTFS
ncbi:aminopeptidase N-like [Ooceraea biroi]|nr:aminopeptidase N-like [Ooceraea biroi]